MIEAGGDLIEVVAHGEPDVLALRHALGGVHGVAHRLRSKGGQIPAAIGEGVVFEVDDRIRGLLGPRGTQSLWRGFALGFVVRFVHRPATADDADEHVGLQLVDLQRWQRIDAIRAVQDFGVRMRFADFFGHAIDEVPDVVAEQAALIALGRVFAFALLALANGGVAIGRHDGDAFQLEGVEQRPRIAHGLAEEFVVRVAELAFRVAGLEVGFAAVDREPLGMLCEDFLAIRHVCHAVGDLQALVIANAESHDPQRGVRPAGGKAEVELPQSEVRLHGFIELG